MRTSCWVKLTDNLTFTQHNAAWVAIDVDLMRIVHVMVLRKSSRLLKSCQCWWLCIVLRFCESCWGFELLLRFWIVVEVVYRGEVGHLARLYVVHDMPGVICRCQCQRMPVSSSAVSPVPVFTCQRVPLASVSSTSIMISISMCRCMHMDIEVC